MKLLFLSFALVLLFLLFVTAPSTFAQSSGSNQPNLTINAEMRTEVIDGVIKLLNENYVFPEMAAKIEKAIRDHQRKKDYDAITSAEAFAQMLTSQLQEVSEDKHLRVRYSNNPIPPEVRDFKPSPQQLEQIREFLRVSNCSFEKVEQLPGNVGYVNFRQFRPPEMCAETVVAAMSFLAGTDALIIDLRRNSGGEEEMLAFFASYLFDSQPVHLHDTHFRLDKDTQQWWTLPYVPGKRFGGSKPVYVLTAKRTFSAAEALAYHLKNLKRATIVGETTAGGANPGGTRRVTEHFSIFIPVGRTINPITKTNWEGTGVKPDIEVPADRALKVAHLAALKKIMETTTDEQRKKSIQQEIENLQKELDSGK